ncbi:unnamed protein product [Dibothriocephalus latus]|uniref:Uncharacterized protein n=1 Tax=Dibothriocephalus latus TaxID=60516 RepID=A0A3P7L4I5_DIBLA|nr:unnamed protein product [Dibothriocephalus latus]
MCMLARLPEGIDKAGAVMQPKAGPRIPPSNEHVESNLVKRPFYNVMGARLRYRYEEWLKGKTSQEQKRNPE